MPLSRCSEEKELSEVDRLAFCLRSGMGIGGERSDGDPEKDCLPARVGSVGSGLRNDILRGTKERLAPCARDSSKESKTLFLARK